MFDGRRLKVESPIFLSLILIIAWFAQTQNTGGGISHQMANTAYLPSNSEHPCAMVAAAGKICTANQKACWAETPPVPTYFLTTLNRHQERCWLTP